MPTPSLLIVPARWKTGNPGKLYSQIPTNGNGDFNVTGVITGATNAGTRVNNLGYIEPITTSGTPRLDYYTSGGTVGCPALLVEPAATNLVPSGTVYTALASALVSAVTDTPAIGVSGALCTKNTASGSTAYIRQLFSTVALSSGTTYSVSRFFKYNGVAFNTTLEAEGSSQWGNVAFKQVVVLSAASGVTIGASTLCTGSVENFGNGWYRVNVRVTTGATIGGTANVTILSELPSALSTGQGFLTACPQLETGSVATSYIPTTTGSVTRNADVISVSGAVSGSIGQTEGTIYAEVDVRVLGDGRFATLSDGTSSNRIQCRFNAAINGIDFLVVVSGSSVGFSVSNSSHPSFPATIPAGTYKIALGYKQNDYVVAMNGVAYTPTVTTRNVPLNFSKVTLGADVSDLNQFNNRIRAAALYTTRLTNADLMLLTLPGNNTYLPQAVWDNYLSRTGNAEVPDCLYTRHADLLDV